MALIGIRIDNFIDIVCSVNAWGYDILIFVTSFQKKNIGWPQQPLTEKVLKFNMIQKLFQNIKIKLNSTTWMTLKSSLVIFLGLRTSTASITSLASATSLASSTYTSLFHQRTSLSWWLDPFCEMDNWKFNFSLI